MSDWWKFDGPEDEPLPAELEGHEAAARSAIRAIAEYGEAHPDKALAVTGTLRKISTIAGSKAQSLGLNSVVVKRR